MVAWDRATADAVVAWSDGRPDVLSGEDPPPAAPRSDSLVVAANNAGGRGGADERRCEAEGTELSLRQVTLDLEFWGTLDTLRGRRSGLPRGSCPAARRAGGARVRRSRRGRGLAVDEQRGAFRSWMLLRHRSAKLRQEVNFPSEELLLGRRARGAGRGPPATRSCALRPSPRFQPAALLYARSNPCFLTALGNRDKCVQASKVPV